MNLRKLKDKELQESFNNLVKTERKIMHVVILHVQEVNRRQLYLARACESLHDYLVDIMKYSSSAALRRIHAAQLVTALPEIAQDIQSGQLNLTQIGEINRAVKLAEKTHEVTISNTAKAELVQSVLGLTTSKTQQTCAEVLNIPVVKHQKIKKQKDGSRRVEYTQTKEQSEKHEKVRGILAHKHFQTKRSQDMADVLETMYDVIIEMQKVTPPASKVKASKVKDETSKKSAKGQRAASVELVKPVEAKAVNEVDCKNLTPVDGSAEQLAMQFELAASETGTKTETNITTPDDTGTVKNDIAKNTNGKFEGWHSLTPKRKKIILQEDQCCQYEDYETGKVCGSIFDLNVDHIIPKEAGGSNDPGNLRVLCRAHNLFRNLEHRLKVELN